jgi:hypothetical protein
MLVEYSSSAPPLANVMGTLLRDLSLFDLLMDEGPSFPIRLYLYLIHGYPM